MPIHTVDEMLAVKGLFTQKPFANFSLSNCIARKKQGERLERGANAWGGRHAVSVAEARSRQIQHSLNKLSQEKYDEVLDELQKPELFEPEAIKTLVAGVFQKALAEPFLAALYAGLCFSLSRFEVQGNTGESQSASPEATPASLNNNNGGGGMSRTATPAIPGSGGASANAARPKSLFRATIVTYAQTEFEKEMKMNIDEEIAAKIKKSSSETMTEEEKERLRQEHEEELEIILKKKRANIKFVGHLFLVNVLSMHVMKTIVNFILRLKDTPMHCPSEHDLDVLTILLTTIGARIDEGDADSRQFLDDVMMRLQTLESEMNPKNKDQHRYTMRVRTKVMNLLDLRMKNWTERRNAISILSTSTSATPASIRGASPYYSTPFVRSGTASTTKNVAEKPSKMHGAGKSGSGGGTGSESERSSNVGSTNFDSNKNKNGLQFPDTPSVNTNNNANVSTPQLSTPICFKTALLSGGGASATTSKPASVTATNTNTKTPHSSNSNSNSKHASPAGHGGGSSLFDRVASSGAMEGGGKKSGKNTKQQQPPPLPTTRNAAASSLTKDKDAVTTSSSSKQQQQESASKPVVPVPTRPLGAVIKEIFREWLCSHSIVTNWQSRFVGYGKSEEELRASIVKELVYEACMTTRADAQVEAVMFCKQGLSYGHFDFYPGFQKILRKALAEGVLTDVPKFFDRLMMSMHYAAVQQIKENQNNNNNNNQNAASTIPAGSVNTNSDNNNTTANSNLGMSTTPGVRTNRTGMFRQLSQLMFAVAESNPLDDDSPEANEEVADSLLRLWQAAPRDEKVDDSVVDFILRPRACSKKFPEMVVEMLTFGVHEAKVLSGEPVKKWLASSESSDSPLRSLLATNFTAAEK